MLPYTHLLLGTPDKNNYHVTPAQVTSVQYLQ